uniref:UPAR/Ly6 domain-containing protein n=1 Tax=Globodera pallida TaxID=36090 RepID=A0A183CKD3_GLOPA
MKALLQAPIVLVVLPLLFLLGSCLGFEHLQCRAGVDFHEPENEKMTCSQNFTHCYSGICQTDMERPNHYYYLFGCAAFIYKGNQCRELLSEQKSMKQYKVNEWNCDCWVREKGKHMANFELYPPQDVFSTLFPLPPPLLLDEPNCAPMAAVRNPFFGALLMIAHFFHGAIFTDHQSSIL